MVEDPELLRQYAEQKTDAAFGEFVRRHVDLVYGSALRRVGGDTHLAEDVTQQVFAAAARDAGRLCRHPAIVGWLFAATRNRAAQLVRAERRRHVREQKAFAMSPPPPEPALDWDKLRPWVDELLDELSEADRQAVLLRFFENRSYAEIAAQLHTAENAARMRVDRALDRLNAQLQRKGVTSTTVALATVLLADAMTAAPAGVAVTTTAAALSAAASTSGSLLALMGLTKLHLAAAATAVAVGATGWVVEQHTIHRDRAELAALRAQTDTDTAAAAAEKGRSAARGQADICIFLRRLIYRAREQPDLPLLPICIYRPDPVGWTGGAEVGHGPCCGPPAASGGRLRPASAGPQRPTWPGHEGGRAGWSVLRVPVLTNRATAAGERIGPGWRADPGGRRRRGPGFGPPRAVSALTSRATGHGGKRARAILLRRWP